MRDALPIRLRRAPLHERRELGVPFGAVGERRRAPARRRVAEDLPQRRVGLRRVESVDAGTARSSESRRCSTHCRSSTAASVPLMSPTRYGVSGVARSARRHVLESEALFPDDRLRRARSRQTCPGCRSAAGAPRGSSRGWGSCPPASGPAAAVAPDAADTASTRMAGQHRESCPVDVRAWRYVMNVNLASPTASSPAHGQMNDALRGDAFARTRT